MLSTVYPYGRAAGAYRILDTTPSDSIRLPRIFLPRVCTEALVQRRRSGRCMIGFIQTTVMNRGGGSHAAVDVERNVDASDPFGLFKRNASDSHSHPAKERLLSSSQKGYASDDRLSTFTESTRESKESNDKSSTPVRCRRTRSEHIHLQQKLQPEMIIHLEDCSDDDSKQDRSARSAPKRRQSAQVATYLSRQQASLGQKTEWSWHRLVEQAQWSNWFEELIYCQQRGTRLPDDVIVDASSNTTLLHVAAWKAPPALMLLLLEVLTHPCTGDDAEARTKQYLLCGDANGNTPLHLACANLEDSSDHDAETRRNRNNPLVSPRSGIDFSVIKNLLVLGKEALEMQNHAGDTPLHLLLASDAFHAKDADDSDDDAVAPVDISEAATHEAIVSLLHMSKDLAVCRNQAGLTPLHVAIANQCHESVVLHIIDAADQAAVAMADHQDMIPLHYVAAFGGSSRVAEELIACCPDSICCQTINGDTPLHLLVSNAKSCASQVSTSRATDGGFVVHHDTKELVLLCIGMGDEEMSPLLVQNMDGMTPLHCCATFQTPALLTRLLMDPVHSGYYGRISSVLLSKHGSTALHLALAALTPTSNWMEDGQDSAWHRNAEANAVTLTTPEASTILDAHERTPLMLATAGVKPSLIVIKTLIRASPKSAAVADSKGFLPIHLACQNHKIKVSALKALIRAYPASVSSQTKRGNTPLAEAAKYRLSYAAIELLINECPAALQQRNFKGERPLERALAVGAKSSFVSLLEKATEGGQLSLLAAMRITRAIRAPSHPGDAYRSRQR